MVGTLPTDAQTSVIAGAIEELRRKRTPAVSCVHEVIGGAWQNWRDARTAVVLPGSFNPLHVAHLQLLEAAARAIRQPNGLPDPVQALSLSVNTIDKAQVTGMALHDRAWTMHAAISPRGGLALLASHGLYLDQAFALRTAMPRLARDGLWFAIGYDKAVQIFDPRYYDDRDLSLQTLFDGAGLLVAPRAGADARDLGELMNRSENRQFSESVRPIELSAALSSLSSSAIRSGTASHRNLPPAVVAMIGERRCYNEDA